MQGRCWNLVVLGGLVALVGCASAPRPVAQAPGNAPVVDAARGAPRADSPVPGPERGGERAPSDQELLQRPDPEPRVEPLRPGGPNKPYQVGGESYAPLQQDLPVHERGLASWYGKPFHGRKTASGETFDMYGLTAAHKTLPIPSYVRVRNPANGREVVLRVNDRGPFTAGRIVDLSYAAAVKLGVRGVAAVELTRLTHQDIHSGAWRRNADAEVFAQAPGQPTATTPTVVAVNEPLPALAPSVEAAAPPSPAPASAVTDPSVTTASKASAVATLPVAAAAPPQVAPAPTLAARGFWLQLGAFARVDGAAGFRRQVEQQANWLAPLLAVFQDAGLHRLQAGPYPSRQEAHGAAERLRQALQLVPVVLERK